MKLSKTGYRKNSKDKKEKSLVIPSGRISMDNVEFPVFGIDNTGASAMMMPGGEYRFPGTNVTEFPVRQQGGPAPGYVSQSVGYSPLNSQQLRQTWETNPAMKGKPYRTETEVAKDASGKPYYTYFFYDAAKPKPIPSKSIPSQQPVPQKRPAILDPMKQIGYNGLMAPVQYQLGGMFDNPLVKMVAPIAANVIAPGSGAFVNMGMNLLGNAGGTGGMSNIADMFEKGGEGPMSGDTRKLLLKKNTEFIDYIAANNKINMLKDEVSSFYKMGGGKKGLKYCQTGGTPIDVTQSPDSNFYQQNPFGSYNAGASQVPGYVQNNPEKNAPPMQQFVPVDTNMGQQLGDQLLNQNPQQDQKGAGSLSGLFNGFNAKGLLDGFNKLYADSEARRKEQWLEKQMTIENMAPVDYGSRGDYTVNSGAFRPDQMTPMMRKGGMKNFYKKGGSYTVSDAEIQDLIKQGVKFEFID